MKGWPIILAVCCLGASLADLPPMLRPRPPRVRPISQGDGGAALVARSRIAPGPSGTVTLSWDNPPLSPPASFNFDPGRWQATLEGSLDLKTWYPVGSMPFLTTCSLTLTNRPAGEFYRAAAHLR